MEIKLHLLMMMIRNKKKKIIIRMNKKRKNFRNIVKTVGRIHNYTHM